MYTGEYYSFTRPRAELDRALRLTFLCGVLLALSVFAPLAVKNRYIEQFYTMVPLLAAFVPLWFLFSGLWYARGAKTAVSHRVRDRIVRRISNAALWLLIFSAAMLLGGVVYLFFFEPSVADWCFAALSLLRLLPALVIFLRRNVFAMERTDDAPPEGEILEF